MVGTVKPGGKLLGKLKADPANRLPAPDADDIRPFAGDISLSHPNADPKLQQFLGKKAPKIGAAVEEDLIQKAFKPGMLDTVLGPFEWGVFIANFAMPVAMLGDLGIWMGKKATNLVKGTKVADAVVKTEVPAKSFSLNGILFEETGAHKLMGGVTNRIHGTLDKIAYATGLSPRLEKRNMDAAWKLSETAKKKIGDAFQASMDAAVMPHVETLTAAIKAGHPENFVKPEVMESLRVLEEAKIGGASAKLLTTVGKAAERYNAALGWGNVSKTIKDAPAALAKMPVTHGLMNGGFVVGGGFSIFKDTRTFLQNLEVLKQAHLDMTGKTLSTSSLLFGKVPPVIAEARSHLWKLLGITMSADIVSMGISIKQILTRHFSPGIAMAGFMGAGMVSQNAPTFLGDSFADVYRNMSMMHKSGQPIEAAYYTKLLPAISPELNHHKNSKEFTEKLAELYAKENLSPADIMKKAANGEIVKDIEQDITAPANAAKAAASVAAEPEHKPSMVERVTNGNPRLPLAKALEKPVLGEHTKGVVGQHELPGTVMAV